MAVVSTSWALRLLSLHLLLLAATNEAATFSIINQCPYTVWPAAVPVGGGVQLDQGELWILDVPPGTTGGRVWARTGCAFHGNGNGSCQTGDCGGLLNCTSYSQPPNTLAEFTIGQGQKKDFFDISLNDGLNVPMDFLPVPVQGSSGCAKGPRCAANITSQCPSELRAPEGCNDACTVFNQDKYCCNGNAASNCSSTNYLVFFKQMCPNAFSYPTDDNSTTFSCSTGTNYQIIFCPLNNQTISPAAVSPLPTPSVDIPSASPSPLPAPIGPTKNSSTASKIPMILAVVGGFTLLMMLFILILLICKRRTQRHQEMNEEEEFGGLQGAPVRFTFQQLKVATEHFTEKLGEGGFGSVFKGQFAGESIAVKRLDRAGKGKREFSAEVETIGSIHHINLVRLIGFCAEKSHRLLVYEYMPKGSLDRWIYFRHDNNAPPLDWSTRCKIVKQIAKGLSYFMRSARKRLPI